MKLKKIVINTLITSLIVSGISVFGSKTSLASVVIPVVNAQPITSPLPTESPKTTVNSLPAGKVEGHALLNDGSEKLKFNSLIDLKALYEKASYVPSMTYRNIGAGLIDGLMFGPEKLKEMYDLVSLIGSIGVVNVSRSLNVRDAASADSKIVGKIYQNSGVIINNFAGPDNEWVYVTSGSTKGWVSSKYVVMGELAQSFYEALEPRVATSVCEAKVYAEATSDSNLVCEIPQGAQFPVLDYENDYVRVQITAACDGYIHSEYIAISDGLFAGVNLEDEEKYQDQIDELEKLREEQERKRQEELAKAKKKKTTKPSSSSSGSSGSKSSGGSSGTSEGWTYLGKFRVTFYCVDCNTPAGSRKTYSGKEAKEWHTCAVSSSQISMHSTVKVSGFGTWVAEDTGVGRNQIDLFVSPDECDGLYYRDVWIKN